MQSNLIDLLNYRYATKRMNGQIIPEAKVNNILQAIQLAPTSAGLQPFRVFVISDREKLKEISEKACQQPQILEGSHLLVFASWKELNEDAVNEYMNRIADTRGVPVESLDGFKGNLMGLTRRDQKENQQWAARQAYIALGIATVAAAEQGVDATPMEGFNPDAMDAVLGLEEMGLRSNVLLALGYRDEQNDYLLGAKKVRRSHDQLFTEI
ncbi:nitroreductase family protein [Rurimicrobium arvi]|uniref:NAD(P)H-dependent oxidoreductase n=1 Tax=Rurimicrobium arvi TaxID=2049916 RepID=A0ABP8MFV8_9BACT